MTGEWREFAEVGEAGLFRTLFSCESGWSSLREACPPSISSLSSLTTTEIMHWQSWAIIWKLGKWTRWSCNGATWSAAL